MLFVAVHRLQVHRLNEYAHVVCMSIARFCCVFCSVCAIYRQMQRSRFFVFCFSSALFECIELICQQFCLWFRNEIAIAALAIQ